MLNRLDHFLLNPPLLPQLSGWRRGVIEFLFFGLKEARSCLFAGLFFSMVLLVPRSDLFGWHRYDVLLAGAVLIQALMLVLKLETLDELKAVCLFHVLGFGLEVFKTSGHIASWSYPDAGWSKLFGVPLFAGFMYAAVGSYILQAWYLFGLRFRHHPPYWMATLVALLIYANFFTHHYIMDFRGYLAMLIIGLYARATVIFRPYDRERSMPLLLSFVLIGFFIWLAENISTFLHIWAYPHQLGGWSAVHVGKWGSWSLLVIMTFTIITHLQHHRRSVHVPE
ncbi:DUF817 domain-containing protein [Leeia aquatica]|uniref:DUF817 domain-containing protein n=1 Tax=Leeia aquatica TaxID=2725557 RepID=A0A847S9H5_9NEIS|nr:DUF817 domain-containing protein [Leeia aquatica]NLR73708.1 DUF817 domain-containing protein [Leeia aquatica]